MMGRIQEQGQLFYRFRLDDHVPDDHFLRRVNQFLDLKPLRAGLAPLYSHTGRPSIDPELMIRMLLIGYLYGIRSENCQPIVERRRANAALLHIKLKRSQLFRCRAIRRMPQNRVKSRIARRYTVCVFGCSPLIRMSSRKRRRRAGTY
jgi:transposase